MRRTITAALVFIGLSGCATQGTSTQSYSEPNVVSVVNEKTVNKPYSAVWDGLVKQLAKSFYVINNIDKESRIINVSFTTNSPTDYVDCGVTRRVYTEGDKLQTFEYKTAASAKFKLAGASKPHPAMRTYSLINRTTGLDGRSNVYVAPDEKDSQKTLVTVNTQYTVSIHVDGTWIVEHVSGAIVNSQSIPQKTTSITFNTNNPSRKIKGSESGPICAGNGQLEKEILQLAND